MHSPNSTYPAHSEDGLNLQEQARALDYSGRFYLFFVHARRCQKFHLVKFAETRLWENGGLGPSLGSFEEVLLNLQDSNVVCYLTNVACLGIRADVCDQLSFLCLIIKVYGNRTELPPHQPQLIPDPTDHPINAPMAPTRLMTCPKVLQTCNAGQGHRPRTSRSQSTNWITSVATAKLH